MTHGYCDVPHMVSAVNAFKVKLALWTSQLKCKKLTHFQNVDKMLNNISNKDSFHPENFCIHLNRLEEEFSKRFEELNKDIVACISNLFLTTEIEELSAKFQQVFELPNGVDMEVIDLQNGIEMKARSRDKDFWGLVSRERYPSLSACALKVKAFFGSTYFCEIFLHSDQTGFIRSQLASDNLCRLFHILEFAPSEMLGSAVLEKAFDHLEWPFH
uniref:HAT C-terminal dimerisation domain-containing protein n=1 Tax=Astyanax mexicanus TaxID=7994 RepID=A0A8B9GVQ0_ASTMX